MTHTTLAEYRDQLKVLMDYAVPKEHRAEADALVERFALDRVAMNLLHSFYSYLPEAEDDAVRRLSLIARKQGLFLIGATTLIADYFYIVSGDKTEFLGRREEGIWEEEVRAFFGLGEREAFIMKTPDLAGFPDYCPICLQPDLCPVCGVADREVHVFGCPVEVCPFCNGQVTACDCRFTRLDRQRTGDEGLLDDYLALLEQAGRIPFASSDHKPDYISGTEEAFERDFQSPANSFSARKPTIQ